MANFALLNTQQVPVTAAFADATGVAAKIINPTAVIDNTALATVDNPVLNEDGTSFTVNVITVGQEGLCTLTVTGSNHDGSVVSGTQVFDISAPEVVVPNATQVTITVGTPVDKI